MEWGEALLLKTAHPTLFLPAHPFFRSLSVHTACTLFTYGQPTAE